MLDIHQQPANTVGNEHRRGYPSHHDRRYYSDSADHLNPRCACAARVTVVSRPHLAFTHVRIIFAHALFTHVDAYCPEGLHLSAFHYLYAIMRQATRRAKDVMRDVFA